MAAKIDFKTLKSPKLDQLDLNQVNWKELRYKMLRRKDRLANVGIIIISIVALIIIFSQYIKKVEQAEKKIDNLKSIAAPLKKMEAAENKFTQFYLDFPEVLTDRQIISQINQYAFKHQVKVTSFSPGQVKDKDFFNLLAVSITCVAEDYSKIHAFIKEIEESPYSLRLMSWEAAQEKGSGRRQARNQTQKSEESKKIELRMELASIQLKEEKSKKKNEPKKK